MLFRVTSILLFREFAKVNLVHLLIKMLHNLCQVKPIIILDFLCPALLRRKISAWHLSLFIRCFWFQEISFNISYKRSFLCCSHSSLYSKTCPVFQDNRVMWGSCRRMFFYLLSPPSWSTPKVSPNMTCTRHSTLCSHLKSFQNSVAFKLSSLADVKWNSRGVPNPCLGIEVPPTIWIPDPV